MVNASIFRRKVKVLTSASARRNGAVDPERQILAEEFKKHRSRQYERGESSRAGVAKPRVTYRILLNKWQ